MARNNDWAMKLVIRMIENMNVACPNCKSNFKLGKIQLVLRDSWNCEDCKLHFIDLGKYMEHREKYHPNWINEV